MAHKGRVWPLGFRRDLNLNLLNNNPGWANRYYVDLLRLPPGIGHALQGSRWDCGPEQVTPGETIFWASDPDIFGPFAYDVILSAPIDGGVSFRKRIEIREAIGGTILRMEMADDTHPKFPGFDFFATWNVIFRDPFFFTSSGFANSINATPKLWTDPPPH